jgi:hypothetical protein
MNENEYRVRAVTRYVVTHYVGEDDGNGRLSGRSSQYGEFPNIQQADAVARALHAANPGSTFVTIEDRREPMGIFHAYTSEECERLMGATGGGRPMKGMSGKRC